MALDKRIKVIKREERKQDGSLPAPRPFEAQPVEQTRPAVAKHSSATIINNWVRERRQRKSVDARQAFESLFHKAA